jgi:chromosome segregation ATPase
MVIGPNGTGKSTLVCAICLGLGWDPNNLGRSKDIGEFVKHGTAEAMIEIELAAGKSQRVNPVIRRDIMKANSKSKFLINGERATQKQVTQLAKTFSIQIDNLCQFLPQDRVVEFARLSPVALLAETQRAAAPEEMVEWHNQLKGLRTEQKRLEEGKTAEEGHLKQQQSKQSAAREDVERWNQRQRLVMRSDVLDKCRPVIESRVLKTQFNQVTADAEAAKSELDQLNAEVAPAQQALTDMELYRDQIHVVKEQRRVHVKKAQELADKLVGQIKVQKDALTDNENRVAAEKEEEKKRKQDTIRIQNKIAKFDRDISEAPVAIDETASKTRLSDIRSRVHEIETSDVELTDKMRGIVARSHDLQKEKAELMAQRKDLDTQSGQQASLLKNTSADTAEAWAWFQENRDSLHLQGDVFGPPILTCTVKDPRFADAVEGQLRGVTDVTAITCTNGVDIQVLSNKFFATQDAGGLGLHSITIRTVTQPLSNFKHPVSDDQLREYGFHSWILEHIDGPEPVLAMLCDSAQLHRAAYTPNQLTNAQHRAVEDTAMIMQWIAGREKFRISRRKEYGAVSTSVNALRKAQYFTKDQPSDAGKKRELENTITRVKREAEELKEQHSILREAQKELKNEHDQLESENVSACNCIPRIHSNMDQRNLQADIQQKRKAKAAWDALPDKKREAEEELVSIQAKRKDTVSRILRIQASSEEAVLKVASLAVEYAKAVSRLRQVHETLVEAEIRFVEANSEIDSLKAENRDILEKVNAQTERVNALRERKKTLRKQYNNITKLAQRHINELNDEENEIMTEYQAFTTIEDLNNEAEALRNRLGLLADGNPDAVKAYEVREREIEQILEKIRKAEERLVEVAEQIGEIRAQWEPQLDALVAKISDGFSHNFAKIGCAGEVRVYKDEDFDKWSIQISVRFR